MPRQAVAIPNFETEMALLTQKVNEYIEASKAKDEQFDKRISNLEAMGNSLASLIEKLDSKIDLEIAKSKLALSEVDKAHSLAINGVKERLNIFNVIQLVLSGAIATWLGYFKK